MFSSVAAAAKILVLTDMVKKVEIMPDDLNICILYSVCTNFSIWSSMYVSFIW